LCAKLVYGLRSEGVAVQNDLMGRSVKAQMKAADKLGAKYTMVIGDTEVETSKAKIRDMQDGTDVEIELSKIAEYLK